MIRIFSMKSLYDSKATINFCYFKSWKCCRCSYKFCGNVEKKAQFSTALKTKIALEPEISKKKNKVEFKKEYKELFKLLKARECSLVNKTVLDRTKVCKNASDRTKNFKISENFTDLCNKENISQSELLEKPKNHEITEGIYTVKFTKPKKKKASSKKDSPDSNEENAKKLKRKKKKLSLKQENIKQVTKYSYDVHALKSYVEISINANEVEKTQIYLRKKMMSLKKKYKIETLGVDLYNLLISGWAKKGRLDKIKEVFSFMEEDQVSPNLQSYVGYLEGISNCKLKDINQMQQVIMDMKKKNLCPEDILKKCVFKGDQREKVIEVLGFVGVDVFSDPIEIGDAYSCRLLQKLNAKSFGRGESFPNFGFQEKDIDSISSSQLEMESRFQLRIKSVDAVNKACGTIQKSRTYLEKCENVWREEFTKSINKFKIEEKGSHAQNFYREDSIYPYISVIDTNILVNLMLQQVKALAEMGEFYNPSEKFIFKELGIKVMNHYFIWLNKTNKITDKVLLIYKEYLQYFLDKKLLAKYTPREYWEYLKQQNSKGPTIDITFTPWPHGVQVKIGSKLYSIMLQKVTFDENQVKKKKSNKSFLTPGFYLHCESGFIDGEFRLSRNIGTHSLLCKLYRDAKLDYLEFDATLIPMLSPPKPWVKYDSGGFLITSTPFIRFNENAMHLNDFYSQVPPKNLNPCFDSLNSLSICPWTINKPVLDLIIDVFRKGGDEILDVPLNPNTLPPAPKVLSSMTQQERIIARGKKQEIRKKKCEASSLWYDCLYKLSIANHFRDEVFWFPHNLDFRGRTYPTPPHFNHLGSDLIRSILLFAEGQPLGKNGLDWLKIQLINLTGLKKRDPHSVRLEFANEMIPEILDSADRPFEGNQWWKKSDKPWQTLSCCMELANALKHPNPEEYVSHLPVHQDGSCNGLQHYAALGRDELGAKEVNLHPSSAPQDVYSGVSLLVERERQKEADEGVEIAQALKGFITRKVVKQTVMTYVYGVTKYGATQQILKQIKDIPEFPKKYHQQASHYIMHKIFQSIKEMFTATQEIQDWLTDCAEHITRVSGEPLEWVTPLGLPVIQPYKKKTVITSNYKYNTDFGSKSLVTYSSCFEPYQSPNIRRQKNGSAPNFIHSLDACHMMLTSLFCQRKGITFVSVHDCYWTHASHVEIMNKICREQFISLHKEPILEDLSAFFLDKYAQVVDMHVQGKKSKPLAAEKKLRDILRTVPKKGTFNLEKVLESEYFFS